MKIERISDNQIKFILSKTDLIDRDMKITELAYGTEKTQALFKEMMEQAHDEYDFHAEDAPIMIEAIPLAPDSIMIIVTKVNNPDEIENKFNLTPRTKEREKFIKENMIDKDNEKEEEKEKEQEPSKLAIYSFDDMDDVVSLSVRINGYFDGDNMLIKDQGRYFLILEKENSNENNFKNIEMVLGEYGEHHVSNIISKHYLTEHGEIIIGKSAVGVLADYLG